MWETESGDNRRGWSEREGGRERVVRVGGAWRRIWYLSCEHVLIRDADMDACFVAALTAHH